MLQMLQVNNIKGFRRNKMRNKMRNKKIEVQKMKNAVTDVTKWILDVTPKCYTCSLCRAWDVTFVTIVTVFSSSVQKRSAWT